MQSSSIGITLSGTTDNLDYDSCWCRLEQIIPDETKRSATVADIYKLWLQAATGNTAARIRPDGCPVEFDAPTSTIIAYLGFYLWPSSPSLVVTMSSTFGKFSNPSIVAVSRSFSAMIDHTKRFALPYYMTHVRALWETPVYNALGEQILPKPKITPEGGLWLVFSEECFGAIRVSGSAHGKSVVLELRFIKEATERPLTEAEQQQWHSGPNGSVILSQPPDTLTETYKLTDFKNVISASFTCDGVSGGDNMDTGDIENTDITVTTETLDVVLPQCLEDLLEFCPGDDTPKIFCEQVSTTTIYYNTCTGEIMGETTKRDGNSYCQKIIDSPLSGLGWLPESA